MFKNTRERTRAVLYDADNFRYVLDMPAEGITVDVPYVFRSIIGMTNMTWKKLAQFSGLRSSNTAFVTAYRSRPIRELKYLNEYLVIDRETQKVYYYHKDHKPEGVITEHVGPELINPVTKLTVKTRIPTRALSRLSIDAPDGQLLTMTITPIGGYIFDEFDTRLAISNMAHIVSGSARNLNKILKTLFFIATEAGSGEIVVKIDDNSGLDGGATSTSITLTIEKTEEPSVPALSVPSAQTGTIGVLSTIPAVTVTDTDNKFMQVKVQPFGCSVMNFKGRLTPVEPGQFHIVYGTPDGIGNELAELQIKPYQENCSLGFELKCETTVIRQYVSITATAPAEDTETEPGEPDTGTTDQETTETEQTAQVSTQSVSFKKSSKKSKVVESAPIEIPVRDTTPAAPAEKSIEIPSAPATPQQEDTPSSAQ